MFYTYKKIMEDAFASSIIKTSAKVFLFLIFFNFLFSCKTASTFKIEPTSKEKILEYYAKNGIKPETILFAKDSKSFNEIANLGLNIIPEVIIFDSNGKRIKYKIDGKCQAITNEYVENIENEVNSDYYSDQNLETYLSHFSDTDIIAKIIENKTKKIIFINSATVTHKLNLDNFALKNKINPEKVLIYYANYDILDIWKVKQK